MKLNRHQRRRMRRQERLRASAAVQPISGSRPRQPEPSPSAAPPADRATKVRSTETYDTHARIRNALRYVAKERGHWSGIPLPIEGLKLIIEPTYPNAKEIAKIGQKPDDPRDLEGVVHRNTFYSTRLRCDIYVFHEPRLGGKVVHGKVPATHGFRHALTTLGASDAWGIEQESNAIELLATLVTHRQMRHYLLTGSFLERSKRSGLTYMFRRLRPTVVIDARDESAGVQATIRCALCMHPVAYYQDSWAGAMCPTDDVVAHLMMMRADEPMLWRRSNQHAPYRPEAGL